MKVFTTKLVWEMTASVEEFSLTLPMKINLNSVHKYWSNKALLYDFSSPQTYSAMGPFKLARPVGQAVIFLGGSTIGDRPSISLR